MPRYFCSVAAADRDEPVTGTASRIDRWLLVEAPGPWSPRSLPHARGLPDVVLLDLQRRAAAFRARTLLIRRPGRGDPADALAGSRRIFAADSRPGHERLLCARVADLELAELQLPFADGDVVPDRWWPVERFVGVCTHGRHDPCCAVWGRPVATALARALPEETWEVSHLGGDRFAGNVLLLPHGHYLGRVPAALAADVVAQVARGERPHLYYRGRSCYPMPAQAALALVAGRVERSELDGLVPRTVRRIGEREWAVILTESPDTAGALREWRVVVRRDRGAVARLTCTSAHEEATPLWRLVELAAIR